jgi:hypothetical protein
MEYRNKEENQRGIKGENQAPVDHASFPSYLGG